MKKTLLSLAVLYGAFALFSPYFLGSRAEENIRSTLNSPDVRAKLQQLGIEVYLKNYQRGWFHSQAELEIVPPYNLAMPTQIQLNITHAPLTLSGLNAFQINAHGESQKQSGTLTVEHRLWGSTFAQVKLNANAHGRVNFKGADFELACRNAHQCQGHFSTQGVQERDLNIHAFNGSWWSKDGQDGFEIPHFSGNNNEVRFEAEHIRGASETISDPSFIVPRPRYLAFSADKFALDATRGLGGHVHLNDLSVAWGFKDQGAHQERFELQAKVSGDLQFPGVNPALLPTRLALSFQSAPFSRASLIALLRDYSGPRLPEKMLHFWQDNVFNQDLKAQLQFEVFRKATPMVRIHANINEHFNSLINLLDLRMNPKKGLAHHLYGSNITLFISPEISRTLSLDMAMAMQTGLPQEVFTTPEGAIKAEIDITPQGITINHKALP